jgi:hypothetical protein
MGKDEKVVIVGSFSSSKEKLTREGMNFTMSKKILKKIRKIIKGK